MSRCEKHKKFGVDLCNGCLYEQIQALTAELEAAKKEIERLKSQVKQITFSNDGKDEFAKAYQSQIKGLKEVVLDKNRIISNYQSQQDSWRE